MPGLVLLGPFSKNLQSRESSWQQLCNRGHDDVVRQRICDLEHAKDFAVLDLLGAIFSGVDGPGRFKCSAGMGSECRFQRGGL